MFVISCCCSTVEVFQSLNDCITVLYVDSVIIIVTAQKNVFTVAYYFILSSLAKTAADLQEQFHKEMQNNAVIE